MSREKVLIIEDEIDLLDLIHFGLTRSGYVTEGALDGNEGMEKIVSFNPDVIILDLMLPGVDGWEICEELKRRNKEMPVMMLTAKAMPEDKVRGLEAGAADYMTKPFEVKELLIRIDKLLEKKRNKEAQDIIFHEVANRITTIGCYSRLLSRDKTALQDGNAVRYLDTINHQVECASETISELKALTSLESGGWSLKSEICDVSAILRKAVDSCRASAELRSIRIGMIGVEIAPLITGDSSAIMQVFMNILGNAVKYSAENGFIEARVSCGEEGLSVSIRDEGRGIPEGDLSHIFKNGFRAGNVSGTPGSGIGLYVVKKLVDAMGARLEVKSALEKGSEFTVVFPTGLRAAATEV